jgi:hypothetical protein
MVIQVKTLEYIAETSAMRSVAIVGRHVINTPRIWPSMTCACSSHPHAPLQASFYILRSHALAIASSNESKALENAKWAG